jgi:hypothetical protein
MKLNNVGKCSVYNVSVSVEGDMINNTDTVVGNIDKGNNSTVDLSLKGVNAGSGDFNVTVKYEGADGKTYEIKKSMSLTVNEPVAVELSTEETPAFNMTYVIIAVVVVVVIIVVVTVIRKKKEKKYA